MIYSEPLIALPNMLPDERTDFEERAAICEYDGGLLRREAELAALLDFFRTRFFFGKRP
jgi:hypothetical protein